MLPYRNNRSSFFPTIDKEAFNIRVSLSRRQVQRSQPILVFSRHGRAVFDEESCDSPYFHVATLHARELTRP